jgi:hypothetical protein
VGTSLVVTLRSFFLTREKPLDIANLTTTNVFRHGSAITEIGLSGTGGDIVVVKADIAYQLDELVAALAVRTLVVDKDATSWRPTRPRRPGPGEQVLRIAPPAYGTVMFVVLAMVEAFFLLLVPCSIAEALTGRPAVLGLFPVSIFGVWFGAQLLEIAARMRRSGVIVSAEELTAFNIYADDFTAPGNAIASFGFGSTVRPGSVVSGRIARVTLLDGSSFDLDALAVGWSRHRPRRTLVAALETMRNTLGIAEPSSPA